MFLPFLNGLLHCRNKITRVCQNLAVRAWFQRPFFQSTMFPEQSGNSRGGFVERTAINKDELDGISWDENLRTSMN